MTTAVTVGSPSPIAAASKSAPNAATRDPTPTPFDHQLHAARQRAAPAEQIHAPVREAHTGPGADSAHDRAQDSPRPDSHAHDPERASADRPNKVVSNTSGNKARVPASSSATAAAPSPATVPTIDAPPLIEAVAAAVSGESGAKDEDTVGGEQGAAALVVAMLALVDPAASKLLTSGAARSTDTSGKPVAGDTQPLLIQSCDVAATALSGGPAFAVMSAQTFAVDGLLPDSKGSGADPLIDITAAAMLSPPAAVAAAAPLHMPVSAPPGSHAFAQELGQQVAWFAGRDIQQARIRLHPEELGSLDLKISMNNGRVDVVFQAQHPAAVTAVQQSLPQLGQMLAQHGLSLGHAEVGQQGRGDQSGQSGHGDHMPEIDEAHGPSLLTPLSQSGLLDAFA